MLAVAFFPHRLNVTRSSEATLSQELHTTRLLLLHVSVEYRWQHIGLSPVSRPNGYGCGFVSQSPEPYLHFSMYTALPLSGLEVAHIGKFSSVEQMMTLKTEY